MTKDVVVDPEKDNARYLLYRSLKEVLELCGLEAIKEEIRDFEEEKGVKIND